MRETEYDRSNRVRVNFLRVNWARSLARDAATEWSYPWIGNAVNQWRSPETNSESAQLQLPSFYLSEVHLSWFACTHTALATSKKPTCGGILRPLIPTDTLFERSIPTEEDQSTNEARLLPRTFPRVKCTYGETYPSIKPHLRWEAFPRLKRTHSGDTLHSVKCIYSRDLHNSADRLRRPWRLRWPLRAQLLWMINVHLPYQWFSTAILH